MDNRYPVTIDYKGKEYSGTYIVSKRLIRVSYMGATKATKESPSNETFAKILLRELVEESIREGN